MVKAETESTLGNSRFKDLQEQVKGIPHAPTQAILSRMVETIFPSVPELCHIPSEPVTTSTQVDILSEVLQREMSYVNIKKLLENNIVRHTFTGIKTFDGYTAKQNAVGNTASQLLVVAAVLYAKEDMETAWKKVPYEVVAVETARRLGFGPLCNEFTKSFNSYKDEFDLKTIREEIDAISDNGETVIIRTNLTSCLERMENLPFLTFTQGSLVRVLSENPDKVIENRILTIINGSVKIPYREIDMGTRRIKIFLPRDVLAIMAYLTAIGDTKNKGSTPVTSNFITATCNILGADHPISQRFQNTQT